MNKIMLDTETANTIEQPIPYDISWLVFNEDYEIYEKRAFVVYETYVLEKELMTSAYYASKFVKYEEAIANGSKTLATINTITKIFRNDCKKYGVKTVVAHNTPFDYRSCNTGLRYTTKSKYRYFFPYGTKFEDTLRMSRDTFGKSNEYYRFCNFYGFMTKTDRPQFKAETVYAFLTDNEVFEEEHIGIDDCLIELEIYKACKRIKPNCQTSAWAS